MKLIFIAFMLLSHAFASSEECREFIDHHLPKDFFTGYVSVPEDWNHPEGRKINVFYYGRKDTENLPRVAFFNGGPAGSSHSSFPLMESHPESKKLNFIYIDQRGTGCSDPFPSGNSPEVAKRLAHYTSRSIVKDAEEIRKKLLGENSKWKILGQSFGSLIVHRYISMAPESIDSAHAHGYAIMTDQVEWMKERILSQKRVIEDYFNIYPQDRADLENIKTSIAEDYCFEEEGIKLCGPVIMDILRHPLGFRDDWEFMHWWIENLAIFMKEQPSMMEGLSRLYYSDFTHDSLPSLVINKVEITKGPSDREECLEAFARLRRIGDDPELWPVNECRVLINLQNTKFDASLEAVKVIDPLTLDSVKASLQKNPDLKLFLYAGAKDVFVPTATFEEEARALKGLIHFEIFPESGHEGFNTEQKIWDDLMSH